MIRVNGRDVEEEAYMWYEIVRVPTKTGQPGNPGKWSWIGRGKIRKKIMQICDHD